jgi:hypothetical protein
MGDPQISAAVRLGQEMWVILSGPFAQVAIANGVHEHIDLAQLWAGFMAAASGAMAADLGRQDAATVLAGVMQAVRDVPSPARH